MNKAIALLVAIATAGVVALIGINDAQACDPALESVHWTIPADGQLVPPDTQIMIMVHGSIYGDRDITVTDESGTEVDGDTAWESMAGLFTGFRQFIPDDDLDAGHYMLHVDYEDTEEFGDGDFEMTFEVDAASDQAMLPEAVDFEWYRQTYDEDTGDSCYWSDEFNEVAVEPLAEAPTYYEIIFAFDDGSEAIHILHPDDADETLDNYAVGTVECVSVSAGLVDGRQGPSVERCVPDKCKHHDNTDESPYRIDWDEVSGCEDNGEGDNGEGDNGEGDNGEGDNGEGDNGEGDSGGSDSGEGDSSGSACSSTTGPGSSPLVLLLLIGFVTITRRRFGNSVYALIR